MLEITDSAVKQFKKILSDSDVKGSGIRIYTSGGGCCPSYGLDVSENGEDGDKVIEKDGLKIFLERIAYNQLSNAKIDYINSGERKGFSITGLPTCG
jgi:iron-sulfur cluster assembly accessory protein